MRTLAVILAAGCLAVLPLAAQTTVAANAPGTVLHPGTGALPEAFPAAAPGGGSGFGSAITIVLCGGAGAWLWWKLRKNNAANVGRGERKLAIAETRPLGNRQYLVVADYEGQKFLLGVCPGRIDLLSPIAPGSPPPRA